MIVLKVQRGVVSIVNSSVFRCDRTFEIIDKLWLRDRSYTNTALIKTQDTKYPEFPGPKMVHFTKD